MEYMALLFLETFGFCQCMLLYLGRPQSSTLHSSQTCNNSFVVLFIIHATISRSALGFAGALLVLLLSNQIYSNYTFFYSWANILLPCLRLLFSFFTSLIWRMNSKGLLRQPTNNVEPIKNDKCCYNISCDSRKNWNLHLYFFLLAMKKTRTHTHVHSLACMNLHPNRHLQARTHSLTH